MLTKDQILAANDLTKETVDVPEWGGPVFVRVLTGAERDAFESEAVGDRRVGKSNVRAQLCARAICDERGDRLFSDDEVGALAAKSAAALDRVFEAASRLNGLSGRDVEELEKN